MCVCVCVSFVCILNSLPIFKQITIFSPSLPSSIPPPPSPLNAALIPPNRGVSQSLQTLEEVKS